MRFGLNELAAVRRAVLDTARRAGVAADRATWLTVAVNEAASNAVRHGGGQGWLEVVQDDQHKVVAQVTDPGTVPPNPIPEIPATPDIHRPLGLWLMRECCDRLSVTRTANGTTVSLEILLHA